MPLCNVPLIEYTLEILATADVQEVFIVCTSHIDKIKEYFEQVLYSFPPRRPFSPSKKGKENKLTCLLVFQELRLVIASLPFKRTDSPSARSHVSRRRSP